MERVAKRKTLFKSVSDSATRQIIWRHLNADTVPNENPNAVFSHLPRDSCQDHVIAIVELNLEKGIGLFVDNYAFGGNEIVSCQSFLLNEKYLNSRSQVSSSVR